MGIADNTIVVFTADHGHSLGEHDYWYHRRVPYDASMSIPLIIKAPDSEAGGIVEDQVRSIDGMPTLQVSRTSATRAQRWTQQTCDGASRSRLLETDISYFKGIDGATSWA